MEVKILDVVADFLNGDEWWQVTTVTTIIITVILGLIAYTFKRLIEVGKEISSILSDMDNNPPKDYRPQVYRDTDINNLLKTIKHDTQADRVCVYQYHNGERSIANNPFLKFSCTHENLKQSAVSSQKYMTSMPISVFGHWNKQIFDNQIVECPVVNDLNDESDMRTAQQTLVSNHTTSIYLFPLRGPMGHTFGFGSIEFCCEPVHLGDRWIMWGRDKFIAVGTLLTKSTVV